MESKLKFTKRVIFSDGVTISAIIPKKNKERMEKFCKTETISQSEFIRVLIDDFFNSQSTEPHE